MEHPKLITHFENCFSIPTLTYDKRQIYQVQHYKIVGCPRQWWIGILVAKEVISTSFKIGLGTAMKQKVISCYRRNWRSVSNACSLQWGIFFLLQIRSKFLLTVRTMICWQPKFLFCKLASNASWISMLVVEAPVLLHPTNILVPYCSQLQKHARFF